jgi:hypothetical protein
MLKWLSKIFQKKKKKKETNPNICANCVYWKSEEENGKVVSMNPNIRFCDINKCYTTNDNTCEGFHKEEFEALPNSTSTEELRLDYDLSIERNDQDDTKN